MPYQKSQQKKKVRVSAAAKDTITTRTGAGAVIATNSPTSPILLANADVKATAASLITVNGSLDAKDTQVQALESQLATERAALANLTVDWDAAYDVFVSTARLYCVTDQDAQGLGLTAVGLTVYALVAPLAVAAQWDAKDSLVRIHVKRAPGLRAVRIEVSPDPITATSFKALDGDGATAALPGYAPGTYWVRAASVRAREVSAFTATVSVIVK